MDAQSTQYTSLHIGHLGLVADMLDEIGLIQEIDKRLPIIGVLTNAYVPSFSFQMSRKTPKKDYFRV